jgi:cell division protease FtsH
MWEVNFKGIVAPSPIPLNQVMPSRKSSAFRWRFPYAISAKVKYSSIRERYMEMKPQFDDSSRSKPGGKKSSSLEEKNEPVLKPDQGIWYLLIAFWISIALMSLFNPNQVETIPYSAFVSSIQAGKVDDIAVGQQEITGTIKDDQAKIKKFRTIRVDDPQLTTLLTAHKIKFQGTIEDTFWKTLLSWLIPFALFLGLWALILGRFANREGMGMGMGPGLMSIEKNTAKIYMESKVKTTFADVAGVDEAKEELQEVIGFLKEPQRYNRLGGHLPKGILLVGPPGTGKTLLARAVAGEAGVPFFSISGSEFVELFVGVGAARVRDLFKQAQTSAPCIIFIDELDALGRARGLNPLGGHDEKEQTLNQLLVEMDGFDPRQGVILLAATNRPEILDAALLRAGRFDRHVLIDRPDKIARTQILKVHLRNISCGGTVSVDEIAASTPGFTGADLANLVNEAVLLATRRGADAVQSQDFTAALERVVAGLEKKNRLLNPKERKVVVYHEMGHALVSLSIPGSDPIQKISIIPRGIGALGYTMQRPTEDRFLMSRQELENKMTILLGGRAAETIFFEDISTGAADDLSKATDIARNMVTRYGMVKALGPVTYESEPQPFLGNGYHAPYLEARRFSEETAREIDCAVRDLVNKALERAIDILNDRHADLDKGATLLLNKETLTQENLATIFPTTNARAQVEANELTALVSHF